MSHCALSGTGSERKRMKSSIQKLLNLNLFPASPKAITVNFKYGNLLRFQLFSEWNLKFFFWFLLNEGAENLNSIKDTKEICVGVGGRWEYHGSFHGMEKGFFENWWSVMEELKWKSQKYSHFPIFYEVSYKNFRIIRFLDSTLETFLMNSTLKGLFKNVVLRNKSEYPRHSQVFALNVIQNKT